MQKKINIGGVRLPIWTVALIGLLILLIPTYVMIAKWVSIDDEALYIENVDSILLTQGESVKLQSPAEDEGVMRELLLDINRLAQEEPLPGSLAGYTTYTAEYTTYGQKATYSYYFCEDPGNCYFSSNFGKTYRTNSDAAKKFLSLAEAEPVYTASKAPTLTIGGAVIEPQELDWNYRSYNGEYHPSSASFAETYKVNDMADISMNLSCTFSREPDREQLLITDEAGNEIYSGDVAGMVGVTLEKSISVNMTLTATWDMAGGAACGGSAVYKLKGTLHAPAEFYLNAATVTEGGFVVVTGSNVLDMSELSVRVESVGSGATAYNYQPTFYQDGEFVRALIPVSKELGNKNCTYRVLVGLGANNYEMSFTAVANDNIVPASRKAAFPLNVPSGYELTANPYTDLYTRLAGEFDKNTDHKTVNMGTFASPCTDKDAAVRSVYGTVLTYTAHSDTSFIALDRCWVGSVKLYAMQTGKVVYVGNDGYTGMVVVLDHGLGLYSWYWNLSPDSIGSGIMPGATVEAGTMIGKNGGNGLNETYNGKNVSAHTALTVCGVPVDDRLLGNGVGFGDGESTRVIATSTANVEDLSQKIATDSSSGAVEEP